MSTSATEYNAPQNKAIAVRQYFNYVDFGVGPSPLPIPFIKFGCRIQNNHHGMDMNVQATYFHPLLSYVKGSLAYQYYFNPNIDSQTYLGVGTAVARIFKNNSSSTNVLSPEFTIGKQFTNENGKARYIQMQIHTPICYDDGLNVIGRNHSYVLTYTPFVTLSYGIGF